MNKIIFLSLAVSSLSAMEQRLLIPKPTKMEIIKGEVKKVNDTIDEVLLNDNRSFVIANLTRATAECACGTCLACGALAYSCTNPLASLATLSLSLSCLVSAIRTGIYTESLTEIPDNTSDECAHAIGNCLRIGCCIMPRVSHESQQTDQSRNPEGYEEL